MAHFIFFWSFTEYMYMVERRNRAGIGQNTLKLQFCALKKIHTVYIYKINTVAVIEK